METALTTSKIAPQESASSDIAAPMEFATRDRLLFLHVPKTAGMSMRTYLMNQYPPEEWFPPTNWAEAMRFSRPLRDFRLYSGHYRANFIGKVPSGTRSLVVLRDPVPRLLSALRHLRRDPDFHPDHVLAHGKTLSAIVRSPEIMANQYNIQTGWLAATIDTDIVDDFLRDNPDADAADVEDPCTDEALFLRARQALEPVDFIGFTEDLRPLLAQLSDEMDFHPVVSFPHLNEGRNDVGPADRITKADFVHIRRATALDQRLYDFAKDLVEQRRVLAAIKRLHDNGRYYVPQDNFEISLQAPIPGSGWYEAEAEGGGYYRWTGPGRHFTLDLPLEPHAYEVLLEFDRPSAVAEAIFTATVNMVPLTVEQTHVADLSFEARFIIPQSVIVDGDGLVRLVLDAGPTVRPADHGGTDDRVLGVVVFRIGFMSVEEAPAPAAISAFEHVALMTDPWQADSTDGPGIETEAPAEVVITGDGVVLGKVEGLFHDGWVGPGLRLAIQPHRPVQRVVVRGWFHDDVVPIGEVRLRIGDRRSVRAITPGMFALSLELPEPMLGVMVLEMDATHCMASDGLDERQLAFVLQRIVLEH
ncbi:MAG: sulfotransferase family 2 domain-containing protein [Alphaproteobacteria bacterium]|nr:sulfotransferase family 2 domain-containing protein [Alphaproteobacteria bacterium]